MITISIDEVCETAHEMLDELAATTPLIRPNASDPTDAEPRMVSIEIDIIGPFTTTLVVRLGIVDARTLSAAMLEEPYEAIDEATTDETMAEIANVIAGGVKGLVADETHLGIPKAHHVDGRLGELADAGIVDHDLGRFEVGLREPAS